MRGAVPAALHFPRAAGIAGIHGVSRLSLVGIRWAEPRRRGFSTGAASIGLVAGAGNGSSGGMEQGSEEWLEIRKDRLTASTFATALGFFRGKRIELWEEKVGLRGAFKGNQATKWGVDNESIAVESYKRITGHLVDHIGFKIYKGGGQELEREQEQEREQEHDDQQGQEQGQEVGGQRRDGNAEMFSWLGASPDGLIEGNESESFENRGILEVKCPHMRGRTNVGVPWSKVPHYYIPQLQGLLEIIGRDWMDFYVWTGKGSACFRVTRDAEYWDLIHELLSEFWFENVVPARKARESGENNLDSFKPGAEHPKTGAVIKRSKELGKTYPLIWRAVGGSVQPVQAGLNLTLSILAAKTEIENEAAKTES